MASLLPFKPEDGIEEIEKHLKVAEGYFDKAFAECAKLELEYDSGEGYPDGIEELEAKRDCYHLTVYKLKDRLIELRLANMGIASAVDYSGQGYFILT